MIFVFGSNEAGRHGKGAALFARENHGAEYGVAVGRTGNAYAIPTKNQQLQTLPLAKIAKYVQKFIWYAERTPHLEYEVTRIGCGLAGYTDSDIAPMFADAPTNCNLPDGWRSNAKSQATDAALSPEAPLERRVRGLVTTKEGV